LNTRSKNLRALLLTTAVTAGLASGAGTATAQQVADSVTPVAVAPSADGPAADAPVGDEPSTQIIGGHRASEVYPWAASLMYDAPAYGRQDWHTCGATLIERGWLATAAHCVTDPPSITTAQRYRVDMLAGTPIPTKDKAFHVSIGATDRTQGTTATVVAIYVHPGWTFLTKPGKASDVAVLKLDHQVEEQAIEIPGRATKVGSAVRSVGWGLTDPAGIGTAPQLLQEYDTKTLPAARCTTGAITVGDICLDNPNGRTGACYGDSGSAAIEKINRRWQFVGIVSRSGELNCGEEPTVYTSAPDYAGFMYDVMTGKQPPVLAATGGQPTGS